MLKVYRAILLVAVDGGPTEPSLQAAYVDTSPKDTDSPMQETADHGEDRVVGSGLGVWSKHEVLLQRLPGRQEQLKLLLELFGEVCRTELG